MPSPMPSRVAVIVRGVIYLELEFWTRKPTSNNAWDWHMMVDLWNKNTLLISGVRIKGRLFSMSLGIEVMSRTVQTGHAAHTLCGHRISKSRKNWR
jgi:hypothetical protein